MLVARLPASTRPLFATMTHLGDPAVVIVLLVAVAGAGFAAMLPGLVAAAGIALAAFGANTIVKILTSRSRPLTQYVAAMKFRSYSFPSGHTAGATLSYGLLAACAVLFTPSAIALVAVVLAALIVAGVGVSRVAVGAHFPSDVIGGWLLGGLGLVASIAVLVPLV